MSKKDQTLSANLSPHLFWDADITSFNADDHKAFIIKRALEYGLWTDFLCIKKILWAR